MVIYTIQRISHSGGESQVLVKLNLVLIEQQRLTLENN